MKGIGMIIFICLAFCSSLYAGEIFVWTDESGIKHITDTPPPEKKTVKLIEKSSYKNDSPAEIRAFEQKNKAAVDRAYAEIQVQERIRQQNQQNQKSQSNTTTTTASKRVKVTTMRRKSSVMADSLNTWYEKDKRRHDAEDAERTRYWEGRGLIRK